MLILLKHNMTSSNACQRLPLLGRFHLADFLRPKNRERSGVFFDVLFNLGEFLAFEGTAFVELCLCLI